MNAAEHESNQQAAATTEAEPRPKKRGFLKFPRSWAEVKKMGWKFIVAFIVFYLIRDTLLYILLPYLIYKGVISF
jgi:hypothetical protein